MRYSIRELLLKTILASKPSDGVPANWEKNEGHVELESLGCTLSSTDTISHDMEHITILVLEELPNEEANAYTEPEEYDPYSLPIVLDKVGKPVGRSLDGVGLLGWNQLLAEQLAQLSAIRDRLA